MAEKSGDKSGRFAEGYDPRRGSGPKPGHGGRPTNRCRALARDVAERGLAEMRRRMGPKVVRRLDSATLERFTALATRHTMSVSVKMEALDALAFMLGVDPSELPPPP